MTHKRIAFIGQPGAIADSFDKPTSALFKECGLNTGNLAFWYAMNRHIAGDKTYLGWGTDPAYLRDNFDAIVFPAANQLNPDWDMGVLANLFEKADLPLLICGLGVQAQTYSDRLTFKPGSQRFMNVIAERAVRIGVRGEFTAEVLHKQGISNVDVIGCPSNFINEDPHLGIANEQRFNALSSVDNVVMNLDVTAKLKTLIQACYHWGKTRNTLYVHQAPEIMVQLGNNDLSGIKEETLNHVKHMLCPEVTPDNFKQMIKRNFNVFFDTTEWMHQLQKADLSIGSRMHGNMLAWQAGIPCVLFPHDTRTLELTQLMQLPYIKAESIAEGQSFDSMLSQVQMDGAAYDTRRRSLLSRYTTLLNETNIAASDALNRLAYPASASSARVA